MMWETQTEFLSLPEEIPISLSTNFQLQRRALIIKLCTIVELASFTVSHSNSRYR